ncbi:MAG: hypothetical protein COA78_36440 [Blastopirellula sp.]|nr:MAG: hypothetical protein COA78_36440 [Blastopirellula sp.]
MLQRLSRSQTKLITSLDIRPLNFFLYRDHEAAYAIFRELVSLKLAIYNGIDEQKRHAFGLNEAGRELREQLLAEQAAA